MAGYYTYLLSSLPLLSFSGAAPFSYDVFLEKCAGLIPDKDLRVLRELPGALQMQYARFSGALREWMHFEVMLRNEIARIRAERLHQDAAKYYRADGYASPQITHLVQEARRSADPLKGEKVLDEARWGSLEGLSAGHYLDREALILYALKLRILLRWKMITECDSRSKIEEALAAMEQHQNEG